MDLAPIELPQIAAGSFGFVINGAAAGDNAGHSLAAAGDINGDGFADIIIGAPFADPAAGSNAGRAYVVFGRAQPFAAAVELSAIAAGTGGFSITGRAAGDVAGSAVASAGDVNGDGYADLLIGAFGADPATGGQPAADLAGESYVVFGAPSGLGPSIDLAPVAAGTGGFAIPGGTAGDRSGAAVAPAGDIDGDGLDDVLVGAYGAASFAGRSYLVYGGGTTGFAINGQAKSDQSGFVVSGLGDINGDGRADIAIGARFADTPAGKDSGRTYVMFGTTDRPTTAINLAAIAAGTGGFVINGRAAGDLSGHSVAAAGDINGDGLADLVIGAPFAPVGSAGTAGQTYVVFGRQGGFGAAINLADIAAGKGGFVLTGEAADDLSGVSAAAAGDLNGDGFDDLVIGAHLRDLPARADAGRSYVLLGRAAGFGPSVTLASLAAGTNGFAINGQAAGDLSGFSVAGAGDIDGDGFADLLVGAEGATTAAGARAGRSYVILGRDFTGSVSHPGSTGAETLTGGAAADTVVGGQDNDILIGNGGADVLLGGAGDDTLRIADLGFRRADGGGGVDTLALDGTGLVFDLTALSRSRLRDIERFDLTGSGDNRLLLSAQAVTALSSSGNTLRIDGNAGDIVVLRDAGWLAGPAAGGTTRYTLGTARLDIADGLTLVNSGALSILRQNAFRSEGTGGTTAFTFIVNRAGSTLGTASAAWSVSGGGVPGTVAADAADFAAGTMPSGTVLFADGQASAGVTVSVLADALGELNESFAVTLSNIQGNAQSGTASTVAAILNDDMTLAIFGISVARPEGTGTTTPFTFNLARRGSTVAGQSVQWSVAGMAGSGTLPANAADFAGGVLPSGTVTFAAGEANRTLTINVLADSVGEFNERFEVTLANPSAGLVLATASAGAVIFNDDTSLAIGPPGLSRAEGNAGATLYSFTVGRSGTVTGSTSVDWTVTPGGVAGTLGVSAADFAAKALPPGGILTFAPHERIRTLTLAIAGDTNPEFNESFTVSLSNATGGAVIVVASAAGIVFDNDIIYGTNGNDTLSGTAGADLFVIGRGQDSITGGTGLDTFRFLPSALGAATSNAFSFEDFNRALGEKFDLSRIDAIAGTALNDAFAFIGTAPFSGAPGELRWEDQGGQRLIQGNTTGDTTAELTIIVKAAGPLEASWFVL